MTLLEYYKIHIFDYGYHAGYDDHIDFERGVEGHKRAKVADDIYFKDEMDYYICADYYGLYVGSEENWTQEDLDFLEVLGFGTGDFYETEVEL